MTAQEKIDIAILSTKLDSVFSFIKDELKPHMEQDRADRVLFDKRLIQCESACKFSWVRSIVPPTIVIAIVGAVGFALKIFKLH